VENGVSTATHYPESGFKAGYNWHQTALLLSGQPGTLANWQSFTALVSGDLTALGTDDSNGVSTEAYFVGGDPSYIYAGGVASRFTIADGTVSQLDITIKAVDNGGTGYHFWAYNFHTSSWSAIGSHTGGAPATFTFTCSLTSNPAYYLDGSNHMWLLCCTDEYDAAPSAKLTVFMKVVDTYTAGGNAYTLSCAVTTFAETSIATTLKCARKVSCGVTTFAETSIATTLKCARKLSAGATAFTATSVATGLLAARKLAAGATAFTATSVDVGLRADRRMAIAPTTYTLTSVGIALRAARKMVTDAAAFVLTSIPVGLNRGGAWVLDVAETAFAMTSIPVMLRVARRLVTQATTFSLTSVPVQLFKTGVIGGQLSVDGYTMHADGVVNITPEATVFPGDLTVSSSYIEVT
jgi:hypothetical protein